MSPSSKNHAAFELLHDHQIESLGMHAYVCRHRATQALHLHLASPDEENVFMVAFRTMPEDSSGVAHVLEHTALCGSKKYPVRDPFFMMLRRSLNTFMNAFTSSDWTAYPFATKNAKDFDHLLSIYLDAAFHPSLNPLDFAQEGHRLAFEKPDDTATPLSHHGVVYNEMKGAMSDPSAQLWQHLSAYLYPTTTYHHNSGGDPQKIVDLTHDQLTGFFKTHYHPSNAIFMTVGNRAMDDLQQTFDKTLAPFKKPLGHAFKIGDEQRYAAPLSVTCAYPSTRMEKQTHVVLGWLADINSDIDAYLDWSLISELLLNNSASPLREALEQTPHAQAPSSLCGLGSDQREMAFVCGVEGSDPEHVDAIEALIFRVLKRVAKEGFEAEAVASILQQFTLSQREIGGGRYPYGLQLMLRALPAMINDADPMPFLDVEPAFERLTERVSDPDYIKQFIQKNLLDNPHRVTLTMKPDAGYMDRLRAIETKKLTALAHGMDEGAKRALQAENKRLAARQAQEDDLSCLPTLTANDIPKTLVLPPLPEVSTEGHHAVHVAHPRTNGLVYQEVMMPVSGIDASLRPLLPYYVSLFHELGCGQHDYQAMQRRQSRYLGGMSAYLSLNTAPDDVSALSGMVVFAAKALSAHQQPMNEIMQDVLTGLRFDELDRIGDLVGEWRLDHEQSITGSGHSMAMLAASAAWRHVSSWHHLSGGLLSVKRIQTLHETVQKKAGLSDFAASLARLHAQIQAQSKSMLWMGDAQAQKDVMRDVASAFKAPFSPLDKAKARFDAGTDLASKQQVWLLDTKVNFSAKVYEAVGSDHPDAPVLAVLGSVMTHGYLHGAIRERGGAYGGGASFVSDAGVFRFYAYRDPRLQATFDDFERGVDWVLSQALTDRHVAEAILSVVSSIDKPSSPSGETRQAFYSDFYGRTKAKRAAYRRAVMGVTRSEIQRVARSYLQDQASSCATVTSKDQAKKLAWSDVSEVDLT